MCSISGIINFRNSRVVGGASHRSLNQDKDQNSAIRQTVEAYRGHQPSPIDLANIENVSRTTFAIVESIRSRNRVNVERDQRKE